MSVERFIKAQKNTYEEALAEIKGGKKRSHWIWFIFPQIQGLGFSAISQEYAIEDLEEAREYLNTPLLKDRLLEISKALIDLPEFDPTKVMGYPDDLKLRSSMTLFHATDPEEPVFKLVLDKYFDGKIDKNTIKILEDQERMTGLFPNRFSAYSATGSRYCRTEDFQTDSRRNSSSMASAAREMICL